VHRLLGELAEARLHETTLLRDVPYKELVLEHANYKILYERARSELEELGQHIPQL